MQRQTREVWADRVAQWQASGLSAAAFGKREGIKPHQLENWRWQLGLGPRKKRKAMAVRPLDFVEVAPAVSVLRHEGCEPFEVRLRNGVEVVVPSRFEAAGLKALLELVAAR